MVCVIRMGTDERIGPTEQELDPYDGEFCAHIIQEVVGRDEIRLVGLMAESQMLFRHTNENGQKNDVRIEFEQFLRMISREQSVWMTKWLEDMTARGLLRKVYAITELGRRYLRENAPPCMPSQAEDPFAE
jgi:hypothetical protein